MKTTCLEPTRESRRSESGAWRLCVTAAQLSAAIEDTFERFVASVEENLGHLETQLAAQAQELLRQPPRPAHKRRRTRARRQSGHPANQPPLAPPINDAPTGATPTEAPLRFNSGRRIVANSLIGTPG